jgi:hypothetical protein
MTDPWRHSLLDSQNQRIRGEASHRRYRNASGVRLPLVAAEARILGSTKEYTNAVNVLLSKDRGFNLAIFQPQGTSAVGGFLGATIEGKPPDSFHTWRGEMRAQDRFLLELYRRTEGRSDRTVHAHLHIAKPLHLSEREATSSIRMLVREGLIATDPMFDRLICLTPTGIAACERQQTGNSIARDVTTSDTYVPLVALRETYAHIGAASPERELVTQ